MALTINGAAELIPKTVAGPIFEKATESSITMQLAQKVPSSLTGAAIPVTVGKPTADWVAEGQKKHVSDATVAALIMESKKVATIILASAEFVKADPGGLYNAIKDQASEAIGRAFDMAALHGLTPAGNPGPFPTYINKGLTKEITLGDKTPQEGGIDGDLTAGQMLVPRFNGYALDTTVRAQLANVRDTTGRRMIDNVNVIGGLPARYSDVVKMLLTGTVSGWGGDWTQCAWGVGMDLTMRLSDQASIDIGGGTVVSLFQTNQVAVLLEASYGFVVNNGPANFVRYLTDAGVVAAEADARKREQESAETAETPAETPVEAKTLVTAGPGHGTRAMR